MDNRNIKINRNSKIKLTALLFSAILLINIPSIFAFGISSPYWKNNPLQMRPGETKEISFNLQNCPSLSEQCDREDINVNVLLEEGEEIAEITSGTQYTLPFGTADTNIILKISIPEESLQNIYTIKFSVSSPADEEGGNVQLGTKYNVEFPVVVASPVPAQAQDNVIQKEKKVNATLIGVIIAILMIIIFIFVLLKLKKRKLPGQ